MYVHSSEIRGLRSTKCFSEILQNLLYFMYKKTHVVFFVFHFVQLYFFPYECPGLCQHTVSLEHFIEHKPLISEEWGWLLRGLVYLRYLVFFVVCAPLFYEWRRPFGKGLFYVGPFNNVLCMYTYIRSNFWPKGFFYNEDLQTPISFQIFKKIIAKYVSIFYITM